MNTTPIQDMGLFKDFRLDGGCHGAPVSIAAAVAEMGYLAPDIGVKKGEKKPFDLLIGGGYSKTGKSVKKVFVNGKRTAAAISYVSFRAGTKGNKIAVGQTDTVIIGFTEDVVQFVLNDPACKIHGGSIKREGHTPAD